MRGTHSYKSHCRGSRTLRELYSGDPMHHTMGLFTGIVDGAFKCFVADRAQICRIKVDKLLPSTAAQAAAPEGESNALCKCDRTTLSYTPFGARPSEL